MKQSVLACPDLILCGLAVTVEWLEIKIGRIVLLVPVHAVSTETVWMTQSVTHTDDICSSWLTMNDDCGDVEQHARYLIWMFLDLARSTSHQLYRRISCCCPLHAVICMSYRQRAGQGLVVSAGA